MSHAILLTFGTTHCECAATQTVRSKSQVHAKSRLIGSLSTAPLLRCFDWIPGVLQHVAPPVSLTVARIGLAAGRVAHTRHYSGPCNCTQDHCITLRNALAILAPPHSSSSFRMRLRWVHRCTLCYGVLGMHQRWFLTTADRALVPIYQVCAGNHSVIAAAGLQMNKDV